MYWFSLLLNAKHWLLFALFLDSLYLIPFFTVHHSLVPTFSWILGFLASDSAGKGSRHKRVPASSIINPLFLPRCGILCACASHFSSFPLEISCRHRKMLDYVHGCSDEVGVSEGVNSSKSSMSSSDHSHCTSFSRLSFDLPTSSPEQNPTALKPHRSSDSSFQALRNAVASSGGSTQRGLSFRDFSLVRQIGSGDIGRVYLCRLRGGGEDQVYAMKVVDSEVLALKKKVQRAETERKIMRMLDHPFLPTLYAEFQASHFSCVVMEYCSGGDLHSLRHKQPNKRFSLTSARYYLFFLLPTFTCICTPNLLRYLAMECWFSQWKWFSEICIVCLC